ncbi:MAG: MFS transporter [Thermoproteales archaeon]|nr:MFS transporter [Thermoproteales archaeon]
MKKFRVALILFIYYVFIAAANTLLGPIVPILRKTYKLEYSQISYIASMSYFGGFLSFIGGILVSYVGYYNLILFSTGMIFLGLSGFPSVIPSFLMYFLYFLIGLGTGFFEIAVNPIIGFAYKEKKGMVLNLVHIGWNIGAFLGPALITLTSVYRLNYLIPYYIISLCLLGLVSLLFTARKEIGGIMPEEESSTKIFMEKDTAKKFFVISLVMFLYLGIEQAINVWLPSLLYENNSPKIIVEISLGLFWISLGIGRMIWSIFVDKIGFRKAIGISSILAFLFLVLGVFERSQLNIFYWIIVGFLFAPMFPTIYGLCIETCKKHIGIFSGLLFSIGILGSFTYSLLIGFFSSMFSLYISFLIVLVSPVFILILLFIEKRL